MSRMIELSNPLVSLASVFVPPWLTVPIGLCVVAGFVYYWIRLGDSSVPATRRVIRRWSLAILAVACIDLVVAMSFADPDVRPKLFVSSWFGVMILLFVVVFLAVVDIFNNLRLQHSEFDRDAQHAAAELTRILKHHERNSQSAQHSAQSDHQPDQDT